MTLRGLRWLSLSAMPAWAADAPTVAGTSAALFNALLALSLVLAMLYGFFWLLRRFGPSRMAAQGAVKVVGGVMLGTRERLVVVEVKDTWLLVGVAAGGVNLLHTMAKPEGAVSASPLTPPFAAKLADLLSRADKQ